MRRAKYGNKPTQSSDGITHASKKQALRWATLQMLVRAGEVRSLRREVPYRLEVNGQLICKYIADHVYEQRNPPYDNGWNSWLDVVEDVKSEITRKDRVYRLKTKLMKAVHGIEVREV